MSLEERLHRNRFFIHLIITILFACLQVAYSKDLDSSRTNPSGIFVDYYSLQSPFDGWSSKWDARGATLISNAMVRLTPNHPSRTGSIWSKKPFPFKNWQVQLQFRIHGSTTGADGLAFWLASVASKESDGIVYGGKDKWKGLGIFFDTFDNDGRGGSVITATFNDGTTAFDVKSDGISHALGYCTAALRNSGQPLKVFISYQDSKLFIAFKDINSDRWVECVNGHINIATNEPLYIGVTAATGGLVDFHDLFSLQTYSLDAELRNPDESQKLVKENNILEELRLVEERNSNSNTGENSNEQNNAIAQESVQPSTQQADAAQKVEELPTQPTVEDDPQVPNLEVTQPVPPRTPNLPKERPPPRIRRPTTDIPTIGEKAGALTAENIERLSNLLVSIQSSISNMQTTVQKQQEIIEKQGTVIRQHVQATQKSESSTEQFKTIGEELKRVTEESRGARGILEQIRVEVDRQGARYGELDGKILQLTRQISSVQEIANQLNKAANQQSSQITQSLNSFVSSVESIKREQAQTTQQVLLKADQISNETKSASTSFWIFFAVFQVFFAVAFAFWKKLRDDKYKKVL